MVQINIPGAVGVSTTPSTALQERKRIAGLAKNIGMRTHEDLLARTEEDRLRARGANVQQQLEGELEGMKAAEQVAAAFPDYGAAPTTGLEEVPVAEQVDTTADLSPEELAARLNEPVFAARIGDEQAAQDEKLQQLKIDNRLLGKYESAGLKIKRPALTRKVLEESALEMRATGRAGKLFIDALSRWGTTAALTAQNMNIQVNKAQRAALLDPTIGGSWKVAQAAKPSGKGEPTPGVRESFIFGEEEAESATAPIRKSDNTLNTNLTNIVLDILGAGYLDTKGQIAVDPELSNIMVLNAEQSFVTSMFATDLDQQVADIVIDEDADTKVPRPKENDPKAEQQVKEYVVRKSDGLEQVGKDIYREYMRLKALTTGQEPDAYMEDINDINKEVFIHLGSRAKELYYKANSAEADPINGILKRPKAGGTDKLTVEYLITPKGASLYEDMYRLFTGLFDATEVKPQKFSTSHGKIAGEGGMITRRMTTWMSPDIGDTTMAFNAMANQNLVGMDNDVNRSTLSAGLYAYALAHGGGIQQADEARHDQYVEPNNERNYYADIFNIGRSKFDDLQSEKNALHERVDDLKRRRAADPKAVSQEEINVAQKVADNYQPRTIFRLEREKSVNIAEAMLRYDGGGLKYLTYALQLLTGRMHAQQTLYNPQAHPMIRNVVSGQNKFIWKAGVNSFLEEDWREGMYARLFEDPKVSNTYSWKRDKGRRMPTEERLRRFAEEEDQARANPNEGLWNQYVAWGNELIRFNQSIDKKVVGSYLSQIKNGTGGQGRQIRSALIQQFKGNTISEPLRAYLAKYEHEGIKQGDYLMALAKYTDAKKNGQQFVDTQSWEMDGQTHGTLTMGAQFGSLNMTKRGDMITAIPLAERMSSDEYIDLRDAMANTMVDEFGRLNQSDAWRGKVGSNSADALGFILTEALKDRTNFLKKSPMTMGYGQNKMLLKKHVQKTVDLNPKIREAAANNKLGLPAVVDFLHNLMVDSIYANMDGHTIDTMDTIKSIAWQSVLLNEMIEWDQPTGITVRSAGMEFTQDKDTQYKITKQEGDRDALPKSGIITDWSYKGEASAQALRRWAEGEDEIGGWTVSRILAAMIQGYDPDITQGVFNNVKFTGRDKYGEAQFKTTNHWDYIQLSALANGAKMKRIKDGEEETVGRPFVLQIYDAFVVDTGSLRAVKKVANQIHRDSIINENVADKIFNWYYGLRKKKIEELSKDNKIYDMQQDFAKLYELFTGEQYAVKYGPIQPYKQLVRFLKKNIREKWNREATEVTLNGKTYKRNKETLKDWNKRLGKVAFAMAIDIQEELGSIKMSRTDASNLAAITGESEASLLAKNKKDVAQDIIAQLNSTGKLSGTQVAKLLETINRHIKIDASVEAAKKNVREGKREVRGALSQSWSNNIDFSTS